ncbi:MAG: FtsX-like permease family protein [Acidobacteriota bacterium]|nr:FtsX-like permease family protein [Acidobacteriota bacterium]
MDFVAFMLRGVWAKKARSIGLAMAIAFAVLVVVTLQVTSTSLEQSAAAVMSVGKADITVVQKGVADILASTIDQSELSRVEKVPGVSRAVGVLVATEHLSASTPLFIEIGISPRDLTAFGVTVVAGHPYAATATDQVMLGWRTASNLGLHVGDRFYAQQTWNTVVGIYSTGNSFGDAGAMLPLPSVQSFNRLPGVVTLVFVKVAGGEAKKNIDAVVRRIEYAMPELTTVTTAAQFGRADRNLVYLQAAVTASSVLAIAIGAVIVGNTLLLSLFERTREFGLLRAVGWTRRRLVTLLLGESLLLAFVGAAVGVGLSFGVIALLEQIPSLNGVLHATFTADAFTRGLTTAVGMTILGSLYPSIRAARLVPLKALSYE